MFWKETKGWYGKQLNERIRLLNNGDTSQIPWIFCVFSEHHRPTKLLAAKSINEHLIHLSYEDIVKIDGQMRQTTSMEWSIDWRKINIDSLIDSKMSMDEQRAVLIFSSFNPNGFIREQAVNRLAEHANALPYLILRLNDWVLQVRNAALLGFEKRLSILSKGELLASVPYIEKLERGNRGYYGKQVQMFNDLLTNPEHFRDLTCGLRDKNIRIRRVCIIALLNCVPPNLELACAHLKYEREPFLRRLIFKKLCLLEVNATSVAHLLLKDKYPANRILAIQYIYEFQKSKALNVVYTRLLDKNATVRDFVRKIVLENKPEFDFAEFYSEHLSSFLIQSILGLGETGCLDDAVKIEEYLADSNPSIVRAAMISLTKLNKEQFKNVTIQNLDNPYVGISKTSCLLLLKYGVDDFDCIFKIFQTTQYEHTRKKCLSILDTAPKWSRIIYMLEAFSCEQASIRQYSLQAIQRWLLYYNKSFSIATEQQEKKICALLCQYRDVIPRKIEKELLFTIPNIWGEVVF